jgi:hypothetical protein
MAVLRANDWDSARRYGSAADGVANQPCDVMNAQSFHQLPSVRFHSLRTHVQQESNLLGRTAFGDEMRDLTLSGCQLFDVTFLKAHSAQVAVNDPPRNARIEIGFPTANGLERCASSAVEAFLRR